MIDSPVYRMADALTGGKLADILRQERAAGKSLRRISVDLQTGYGVDVTGQTVANWCDELGIEKTEAAS